MLFRRRATTVLLVEDDDLYARAVQRVLAASEAVEVLGRARDGAEGVGLAFALQPDCILMDLSLPFIDGLEATRAIRSRLPFVRVVVLTSSDDPADRERARAAGATGYLRKDSPFEELEPAVTRARRRRPRHSEPRVLLAGGLAR